MSGIITVNCPICKKVVVWETISVFRPFCSRNCQLIDLNEWVTEEKQIPSIDITSNDED